MIRIFAGGSGFPESKAASSRRSPKKAEGSRQKAEGSRQKAEGSSRKQKTENRKQKAENRKQRLALLRLLLLSADCLLLLPSAYCLSELVALVVRIES
jgi:hypothetical protein